MIRLFSSELLRARSRRVLWVTLIGCAVATVLIVGFATIRSSARQELADRELASFERAFAACLAGGYGYDEQSLPQEYDSLQQYCEEQVQPESFHRGDVLRLNGLVEVMKGSSFVVLILALALGASFAGADWHTGTMATILTWEPRRLRVLAVRAAVTALVLLAFAIVLELVLAGSMWLGASLRGSTAGLQPDFWRHAVETGGRIAVSAVLVSWIGLGLAMIGRNTAAALGVLLGYIAAFEVLFRGFNPTVARNLLVSNLFVFIDGNPAQLEFRGPVITVPRAWWVVVIYAVGLLALAAAIFRARDVT